MESKKELLQKIILFSVGLTILTGGIEFLPIFPNYEIVEQRLHQGYLFQLVNSEVHLAIYILILVSHFAGLFLLYKIKPVGRLTYLLSYIALLFVLMLDGDFINRSLLLPLESVAAFLEMFILYLIYFTPLKEEFTSR